jgi:hypothetical protein
MIPNAEIEERLRRGVSNQNRGILLGKEYKAYEMRMIIENAAIEERSNKWKERDGMMLVYETANKHVPVLEWLKRWARAWRTP